MERYLGESDWEDLDLITTDEAAFRFDEEIAALRAVLADESTAEATVVEAARTRLELLLDAQQRLSVPRKFDLPKS
ncbi:MAG: hypothetical protein ACT4PP_08315 [Sporichthyaceae bacterium]